ncbi:MAG TPA: Rid family hydrolase [Acidimicrobiales bacterium]|nr:Rid family hydrolase [Acidimicrobiales bacterium]
MTRIEGRTTGAPPPAAAYSQSVRIGSVVSVAGQIGSVPETGRLVSDDVGEQLVQAFRNVGAALAASRATLDDVVRVEVYLTDLADFAAMNARYAEIFAPPYPTRTTVGVALGAGAKVEVTVLAVCDAT